MYIKQDISHRTGPQIVEPVAKDHAKHKSIINK